ncbi:MAG: prepilin-type N-terminal cleavage/methylation domain-containing protein [Patescibacteria group bacterium]|nr:prepilin-type N-terminal cleavage/methylation domain-containing protein [Patescibacteria group bacterium]
MSLFIKKFKAEKGVSLLELIVAVAIFSVLMLVATGIFKMVIDGQRSSISAQNVQESMRYAMEKISKEIRMAGISNHDCEDMFSVPPTAVFKVFNTTGDNSKLYFKNQYGNCVVYYLEDNRLKIMAESDAGNVEGFITPAKIEVSNLKFYVNDDLIGALPGIQPYVTMLVDVKAVGQAIHEQRMKIQMTVSSRYYEGS